MFDKINKNSLIDLFITLVKIESPSYQEEKIIRFIMAFLQEQKLKIIFQKVNNTGNIIAYLKGDTKKETLIF